jgi:hypothetical protein
MVITSASFGGSRTAGPDSRMRPEPSSVTLRMTLAICSSETRSQLSWVRRLCASARATRRPSNASGVERLGFAERLMGDALHDGERVLDPVIELRDQECALGLRLLAFR